jgi:O-6-methylguanine DNA methyltransferase
VLISDHFYILQNVGMMYHGFMTDFQKKVYAAVRKIPAGQTRSYKQIAIAIGKPTAFRAVAGALARNTDKTTPCHRVILSSGKLGGYNGMLGSKRRLLKQEGAF